MPIALCALLLLALNSAIRVPKSAIGMASLFMDDALLCKLGKYPILRLGDGPAFYFFNTVIEFNKFLLKGCQTFIQFSIREFMDDSC